jgi:hypothetical protein
MSMLILAKLALGVGATLAVGGAYVFHEGVINVDVDELRSGGSHVHFWVPATAVSLGMRVVPHRHLERAESQVRPFLPVLRAVSKELKRYPNAAFVEVEDGTDHVFIGTSGGKLRIDAVSNSEIVHLRFPVETIEDVTDRLESDATPI